jgi:hypothetical protein
MPSSSSSATAAASTAVAVEGARERIGDAQVDRQHVWRGAVGVADVPQHLPDVQGVHPHAQHHYSHRLQLLLHRLHMELTLSVDRSRGTSAGTGASAGTGTGTDDALLCLSCSC